MESFMFNTVIVTASNNIYKSLQYFEVIICFEAICKFYSTIFASSLL